MLRHVGTPPRPYRCRGDDLIELAWLEWRVNASYRGASPDSLEVDPPRWFIREEIGFAFDCGPSLRWNFETLARRNRAAIKQLGRDAPQNFTVDPRARRQVSARQTRDRRARGESLPPSEARCNQST